MKKPLISVIVPVFKVEEYLTRCVESITHQTYTNLEIILVDDGSPDNCPKMCDTLAKQDKRIKVIHKENGGVSLARNAALDIAKGEFIAFVDSDDFLENTFYEKLLSEQQKNNYDLVFTRYNYYENNTATPVCEKSLENMIHTNDLTYFFNRESMGDITDNGVNINHSIMCNIWRVLFKKDAIGEIRFNKNIKYMEDLIFMMQVCVSKNPTMSIVDEYLYNYLIRENSAGRDKSGKILGNSLSFITALESILKDTKYSPMISAFKFFCYSECVLSKYVVGSGIDLTEVKAWNSSQNYRALKNITFGKKQKLKFFLVRNRFFRTLKLLYKIKK